MYNALHDVLDGPRLGKKCLGRLTHETSRQDCTNGNTTEKKLARQFCFLIHPHRNGGGSYHKNKLALPLLPRVRIHTRPLVSIFLFCPIPSVSCFPLSPQCPIPECRQRLTLPIWYSSPQSDLSLEQTRKPMHFQCAGGSTPIMQGGWWRKSKEMISRQQILLLARPSVYRKHAQTKTMSTTRNKSV